MNETEKKESRIGPYIWGSYSYSAYYYLIKFKDKCNTSNFLAN